MPDILIDSAESEVKNHLNEEWANVIHHFNRLQKLLDDCKKTNLKTKTNIYNYKDTTLNMERKGISVGDSVKTLFYKDFKVESNFNVFFNSIKPHIDKEAENHVPIKEMRLPKYITNIVNYNQWMKESDKSGKGFLDRRERQSISSVCSDSRRLTPIQLRKKGYLIDNDLNQSFEKPKLRDSEKRGKGFVDRRERRSISSVCSDSRRLTPIQLRRKGYVIDTDLDHSFKKPKLSDYCEKSGKEFLDRKEKRSISSVCSDSRRLTPIQLRRKGYLIDTDFDHNFEKSILSDHAETNLLQLKEEEENEEIIPIPARKSIQLQEMSPVSREEETKGKSMEIEKPTHRTLSDHAETNLLQLKEEEEEENEEIIPIPTRKSIQLQEMSPVSREEEAKGKSMEIDKPKHRTLSELTDHAETNLLQLKEEAENEEIIPISTRKSTLLQEMSPVSREEDAKDKSMEVDKPKRRILSELGDYAETNLLPLKEEEEENEEITPIPTQKPIQLQEMSPVPREEEARGKSMEIGKPTHRTLSERSDHAETNLQELKEDEAKIVKAPTPTRISIKLRGKSLVCERESYKSVDIVTPTSQTPTKLSDHGETNLLQLKDEEKTQSVKEISPIITQKPIQLREKSVVSEREFNKSVDIGSPESQTPTKLSDHETDLQELKEEGKSRSIKEISHSPTRKSIKLREKSLLSEKAFNKSVDIGSPISHTPTKLSDYEDTNMQQLQEEGKSQSIKEISPTLTQIREMSVVSERELRKSLDISSPESQTPTKRDHEETNLQELKEEGKSQRIEEISPTLTQIREMSVVSERGLRKSVDSSSPESQTPTKSDHEETNLQEIKGEGKSPSIKEISPTLTQTPIQLREKSVVSERELHKSVDIASLKSQTPTKLSDHEEKDLQELKEERKSPSIKEMSPILTQKPIQSRETSVVSERELYKSVETDQSKPLTSTEKLELLQIKQEETQVTEEMFLEATESVIRESPREPKSFENKAKSESIKESVISSSSDSKVSFNKSVSVVTLEDDNEVKKGSKSPSVRIPSIIDDFETPPTVARTLSQGDKLDDIDRRVSTRSYPTITLDDFVEPVITYDIHLSKGPPESSSNLGDEDSFAASNLDSDDEKYPESRKKSITISIRRKSDSLKPIETDGKMITSSISGTRSSTLEDEENDKPKPTKIEERSDSDDVKYIGHEEIRNLTISSTTSAAYTEPPKKSATVSVSSRNEPYEALENRKTSKQDGRTTSFPVYVGSPKKSDTVSVSSGNEPYEALESRKTSKHESRTKYSPFSTGTPMKSVAVSVSSLNKPYEALEDRKTSKQEGRRRLSISISRPKSIVIDYQEYKDEKKEVNRNIKNIVMKVDNRENPYGLAIESTKSILTTDFSATEDSYVVLKVDRHELGQFLWLRNNITSKKESKVSEIGIQMSQDLLDSSKKSTRSNTAGSKDINEAYDSNPGGGNDEEFKTSSDDPGKDTLVVIKNTNEDTFNDDSINQFDILSKGLQEKDEENVEDMEAYYALINNVRVRPI